MRDRVIAGFLMGFERDGSGERTGHAVALRTYPLALTRQQPQSTRDCEQQQDQEEGG
jgi:hypothetical protein